MRTITVAHDGSPTAQAALAFVAGLPLPPKTRVRVVGVTPPLHYGTAALASFGSTLRAAVADAEEERRRALERTLRSQVSELGSSLTAGLIVVVGNPASKILDEADAADTDLLVVGARGLGPMKRLALGSVSESVVRHALCPVMVVHGR